MSVQTIQLKEFGLGSQPQTLYSYANGAINLGRYNQISINGQELYFQTELNYGSGINKAGGSNSNTVFSGFSYFAKSQEANRYLIEGFETGDRVAVSTNLSGDLPTGYLYDTAIEILSVDGAGQVSRVAYNDTVPYPIDPSDPDAAYDYHGFNQDLAELSFIAEQGKIYYAQVTAGSYDSIKGGFYYLVVRATSESGKNRLTNIQDTQFKTVDGQYGVLYIDQYGSYNYVVDQDRAEYLQSGQSVKESFEIEMVLPDGSLAFRTLEAIIQGLDSPATINTTEISVESMQGVVTGQLDMTDLDGGVNSIRYTIKDMSPRVINANRVDFKDAIKFNADGHYEIDTNHEVFQKIRENQEVRLNLEVTTATTSVENGGVKNHQITISVRGKGDYQATDDTYYMTDGVAKSFEGNVLLNDDLAEQIRTVGGGQYSWSNSLSGQYGSLRPKDGYNGQFTYYLNRINLQRGEVVEDQFDYQISYGDQVSVGHIKIYITGQNEIPSSIPQSIRVNYGDDQDYAGVLQASDGDGDVLVFEADASIFPLGFSLDANGRYSFNYKDLSYRVVIDTRLGYGLSQQQVDYVIQDGFGGQGVGTLGIMVYTYLDGLHQMGTVESNQLSGTLSNDVLYGQAGDDELIGLDGHDDLYGGDGNDTLFGGNGADILYGGAGADVLRGEDGRDQLYGGFGIDWISGGRDSDLIYGGGAPDQLSGSHGDDVIYAGAGADQVFGGSGADLIYGGDGNDTINAGSGMDWIEGGTGDDIIFAEVGTDTVYGGDGADTLYGGSGVDDLYGGSGNDQLNGGIGTDRLYGGDGVDSLDGGTGFDELTGGGGADHYIFQRGYRTDSIIENDTDVDLLQFGSTISADQLWFSQQGQDLLIQVMGTKDDAVLIRHWYDSTPHQVENIQSGDGLILSHLNVQVLVDAMAGFTPASEQSQLDLNTHSGLSTAMLVWS